MRSFPGWPLLPLAFFAAACGTPERDVDVGRVEAGQIVCARDATIEGVDLSHWQGDVDWARVRASGIHFAILKVTEGTTFLDPSFAAHRAGTAANGIARGAYHYFHPASDVVQQADYFVEKTGLSGDGDLPLALDVEVTDGLPGAAVVQKALAFLQRVEQQTGRTPFLYTSPTFFARTLGDAQAFGPYPLWIAHWNVDCPNIPDPPWPAWTLWQYTSTGDVDGIDGGVDRDRFNGTRAEFERFVGTARPDGGGDEATAADGGARAVDLRGGWGCAIGPRGIRPNGPFVLGMVLIACGPPCLRRRGHRRSPSGGRPEPDGRRVTRCASP